MIVSVVLCKSGAGSVGCEVAGVDVVDGGWRGQFGAHRRRRWVT